MLDFAPVPKQRVGVPCQAALYRLYIGISDGMSIARVWTCRYSKLTSLGGAIELGAEGLRDRRFWVSCGLCSYDLYSHGLYSYGLYSYSLYSYGLYDHGAEGFERGAG